MQRLAIRLFGVRARHTVTAFRKLTKFAAGRSQYHRPLKSLALFATSVPSLALLWNTEASENQFDNASPPTSTSSAVPALLLNENLENLVEDSKLVIRNVAFTLAEAINSEGGQTLLYITAANTAVYLLWKVAPTSFMLRHFSNSLSSIRQGRYWTSFTSNFSHMGMFHLAANMYLLNRFGYDVADVLGSQRFYLFYGTAGVASSIVSLMFRRFTNSNVVSLGASGAVVATLWLHACFFPDRRMSLIGTDKSVTMQELVIVYTVFDAAGLLGSFGKIDFAAHLGGAFFANFWFHIMRDKLVQDFVTRSHNQPNPLWARLRSIFGSNSNDDDSDDYT